MWIIVLLLIQKVLTHYFFTKTIYLYVIVDKIKNMIRQNYMMEEYNIENLRKLKKTKGISMSWIVNRAVEEYIEEHKLI